MLGAIGLKLPVTHTNVEQIDVFLTIFRCIRFAVRCAGKSIQSSLLQPIAETITTTFSIHPHSCFLYLGSVLVSYDAHCNWLVLL